MGIGLILGLGGSVALARFLASFLHEVSPTDPSVFLGVVALLFVVLFLATYIPARRAVSVDPMVALRHE